MIELTEQDVIHINQTLLNRYSIGHSYIQSPGNLEMVVNDIHASFAGQLFYPTIFDRAAFMLQKITKKHIFGDGNKRTALKTVYLYLRLNHYQWDFTNAELVNFIIKITVSPDDQPTMDWIKKTLQHHTQKTAQ